MNIYKILFLIVLIVAIIEGVIIYNGSGNNPLITDEPVSQMKLKECLDEVFKKRQAALLSDTWNDYDVQQKQAAMEMLENSYEELAANCYQTHKVNYIK